MKDGYRILGSAYKQGITEQEIHHVLSEKNPTRRCYEMHDDENGNAQDMYVGCTGTRPWPIEVGISYSADENIVFHASKVTPQYEKLYKAER